MGLGLARDGSLDVPPAEDRNLAGWYEDGTAPGAEGTAIVAGHVDNAQGPAVFYSLGALEKGHRIEVLRADGRTAVFTIDAIEVYEADAFPDKKVYAPADRAELRVITCGGDFSERTGYQGNVVAYGHLIGVRDAIARK
jgi:sortase (surface protein transpeptidase)